MTEIFVATGAQCSDHASRQLSQPRRAGWTGRRPTWSVPVDPHQVGWEKGLWIPTAVRMTGVGVNDNPDAPGGQAGVLPGEFLQTRIRLDGRRALDSHCGENDGGDDYEKALRGGRRRAGWSTWSVPVDPHQVGWEKGLWIPTAVRMTGGGGYDDDEALRKRRRWIGLSHAVPSSPKSKRACLGAWPTANSFRRVEGLKNE